MQSRPWSCFACFQSAFQFVFASHVSVLDVLPVHQHVVPAQRPHLALSGHHMALQLHAGVSVHLRRRDGVDAVPREGGHRLPGKRGERTDGWVRVSPDYGCIEVQDRARAGLRRPWLQIFTTREKWLLFIVTRKSSSKKKKKKDQHYHVKNPLEWGVIKRPANGNNTRRGETGAFTAELLILSQKVAFKACLIILGVDYEQRACRVSHSVSCFGCSWGPVERLHGDWATFLKRTVLTEGFIQTTTKCKKTVSTTMQILLLGFI